MSWSIEKQMIIEKFVWYQRKGYTFNQALDALVNDKEVNEEMLNDVLSEAMEYKKQ